MWTIRMRNRPWTIPIIRTTDPDMAPAIAGVIPSLKSQPFLRLVTFLLAQCDDDLITCLSCCVVILESVDGSNSYVACRSTYPRPRHVDDAVKRCA